VDILADSASVTVVVRASIVPAVLCGGSLGEPLATAVTVELSGRTRVEMQFQLKFRVECPLAVAAGMRHSRLFNFLPYSYTGTFK